MANTGRLWPFTMIACMTTLLAADAVAVSRELSLAPRLEPFGVLSGQIRDDNGAPLAGISVQASVVSYPQGRRVLVPPRVSPGIVNSSTETDAMGKYRLDLPYGVYYVSAQYHTSNVSEEGAVRVLGGAQKVYYPGTSDIALAATVTLSGGETPGIDFKVAASTGLRKVFVRVEGPGKAALKTSPAGMQVAELRNRVSLDRMPILGSFLRGTHSTSQTMIIDGVPNGSYDLLVDGVMEDGARARGIAPIDIRGEDLHDVLITLRPAIDVAGRVIGANSSTSLSFSSLTVRVGARSAKVNPNGTFVVPGVLIGFYSVTVDGLAPEAYVADIQHGAISLHETARTPNGPELQAGLESSPLQVMVANNGGTAEGVVDGREAAAAATVVLVPRPSRRFVQSYYKSAPVSPAGAFSLRGVAPGAYQLFAWDKVPDFAWLNPEFMSHWEGRGQPISIEAGGTVHVRARLLSIED